jgi:hypothetical protein
LSGGPGRHDVGQIDVAAGENHEFRLLIDRSPRFRLPQILKCHDQGKARGAAAAKGRGFSLRPRFRIDRRKAGPKSSPSGSSIEIAPGGCPSRFRNTAGRRKPAAFGAAEDFRRGCPGIGHDFVQFSRCICRRRKHVAEMHFPALERESPVSATGALPCDSRCLRTQTGGFEAGRRLIPLPQMKFPLREHDSQSRFLVPGCQALQRRIREKFRKRNFR